jgi:hypothetical protein
MPEDDAKGAILRRRARFVAAALATAGIVTVTGEGCGDDTSTSSQKGDAALGGGGTGGPEPCLSPRIGGGGSGGVGGSAGSGGVAGSAGSSTGGTTQTGGAGGLDASIDAAGGEAGMPQPCLAPPPDGGTGGI